MLKAGLIGVGVMGRGHLDNYIRFAKENFPVKLVAVCDIDPQKFEGKSIKGNMDVGVSQYNFSQYHLYSDYKEMLEKEDLDYVDIALPTYLHCEASVYALNKGVHVLCEKPMAMTVAECRQMTEASEKAGKKLMIGQCLRFWPMYEHLKACVSDERYGKVISAYFFRGGGTPRWSYENWLLTKDKSGGCLLDQHIHDVDMINYLFGLPEKVSTVAKNAIPGSGYDAVSTNYIYPDGKMVNAQDDWTIEGKFGFEMIFRVNFERGNLVCTREGLTVNENDGNSFKPELCQNDGYYREMTSFANAIINNTPLDVSTPQSTTDTIYIAECELKSADLKGEAVTL